MLIRRERAGSLIKGERPKPRRPPSNIVKLTAHPWTNRNIPAIARAAMPRALGRKRESHQLTGIPRVNPAQKEAEPSSPCRLGERPSSSGIEIAGSSMPRVDMTMKAAVPATNQTLITTHR